MSESQTMKRWREIIAQKDPWEAAIEMADFARAMEYARDEARIEARRYRTLYFAGEREAPFSWELEREPMGNA